MSYYLNLFSPTTWSAFLKNGAVVSGFSRNQRTQASRIPMGSILLCYLVGVSRWVGALQIASEMYEDSTPIFKPIEDPFIIRFKVKPVVMLELTKGIPVTADEVWKRLDWTKEIQVGAIGWGANFQRSLRLLPEANGQLLVSLLQEQARAPKSYPLTKKEERLLKAPTVVKTDLGVVEVEIPDNESDIAETDDQISSIPRESLKIQSLLAKIGNQMGFKIWLPRSDRTQLDGFLDKDTVDSLLEELPLAFDEATIRTIENIDVLWMDSRTIVRAFEVEHTTSVHSGLLRMADLIALVPNLNLPLHIVAPDNRKEKVFKEINRPVFLLMKGKLSGRCTFISYESVEKLASIENLQYTSHEIIEQYEQSRDY